MTLDAAEEHSKRQMPSGRFSRIVMVTLGLSVTGVIVGGILGGLLLDVVALASRDPFGGMWDFLVGAEFGAFVGAVLAPVAAWTLMRHVPIWRAITDTAIGTVIGAGIGMLLERQFPSSKLLSTIPLGVFGFALAAVRLRVMRRKVAEADSKALSA